MFMKKKFVHILFHPLILSLPLGLLIILFVMPDIGMYRVKLIEKSALSSRVKRHYFDFNHDNNTEIVDFFDNGTKEASVIFWKNNRLYDQWYFPGIFEHTDFFFFGDYDNNGFEEVYCITALEDSVFINWGEPFPDRDNFHKGIFLSRYGKYDTVTDIGVSPCGLYDITGDGYKEAIFSLYAGMTKRPRQVYAYDIHNDTMYRSPEMGVMMQYPTAFDLNDDGIYEITGNTYAYENNKNYLFSDTSTWLMVFTRDMHFLFDPVPVGHYPAVLQVKPYKSGDNIYLAAFYSAPDTLKLFNINGQLIRQIYYNDTEHPSDLYLLTEDPVYRDQLILIDKHGYINFFDSDLNILKSFRLKYDIFNYPLQLDIDQDGHDEFIMGTDDGNRMMITRSDFSHPVIFNARPLDAAWSDYSIKYEKNKEPQLYIRLDNQSYLYQYGKNPLYYWQFLFYILIYGFITFCIYIIYQTQKYRLNRKLQMEREIAELQLKSVQNQIDPHFTLNLINSIGYLFNKNDAAKANEVFGKYTRLLRNTLLNSDNIAIPLSEEIDYVTNYLELEKFRYDDKFDYKIKIGDTVDTGITIPKMLIHTFVENAVKHGIKHRENNGLIEITINRLKKKYYIEVRDNGVGRVKAREYAAFSTGKGLGILDQILQTYDKLYKIHITYQVTDLFDSTDQPAGTKVDIMIPVER